MASKYYVGATPEECEYCAKIVWGPDPEDPNDEMIVFEGSHEECVAFARDANGA